MAMQSIYMQNYKIYQIKSLFKSHNINRGVQIKYLICTPQFK